MTFEPKWLMLCWVMLENSRHTSLWGDAHSVHKCTINLRTKIWNAYQRNREMNGVLEKAHLLPSHDSAKDWNVVHEQCTLSFHNTCVPSRTFAWCVVWGVLRLSPAFCIYCTHHFHDFVCSQILPYAEIFINVTPVEHELHFHWYTYSGSPRNFQWTNE